MSQKTVEQKAARIAQKQLDCSYNAALMVARSQEAKEAADKDTSDRPFRDKLADVIIAKLKDKEFSRPWEEN